MQHFDAAISESTIAIFIQVVSKLGRLDCAKFAIERASLLLICN